LFFHAAESEIMDAGDMDASSTFDVFPHSARTATTVRPSAAERAGRRHYVLFQGTMDELATRPPGAGGGRLIVTPNVDHLRMLTYSRTFRRAYATADLVLNDSRALDHAFVRGRAFVLTGTDLTPEMLKRLEPGATVYSIGCTPEVEAAMREAYPGLDLRFHNPSMGYIKKRAERRDIVRQVMAARPACVFVSTGAPQSEVFAAQLKRADCDADILCCGSGLLFLAGSTPRAPLWMQMRGGEWLFRFLVEPRTRKRYARDLLFLMRCLPRFLQLRWKGAADFGSFCLACQRT
jgi:N-acetylglucosaminyldiphosphoundecaprenol N-acetyl-beta-D-mannosaminyltransferase